MLLLCLTFLFVFGDAYKILVVFPFPAGSHRNLGEGFVRHLLRGGHEVTYITPFPFKEVPSNLRQVDVSDNIKVVPVDQTTNVDKTKVLVFERDEQRTNARVVVDDAVLEQVDEIVYLGCAFSKDANSLNVKALMHKEVKLDQEGLFQMMEKVSESTLSNMNVIALLNNPAESFDAVITEHMFLDVYCGFAVAFDCPQIWFYPNEPNFVAMSLIDEATNPAYTSQLESSDVPPFTFMQRARSLWFQIDSILRRKWFYYEIERRMYEKGFASVLKKKGRVLPSYEECSRNGSLLFSNSHYSLGQSTRLPQNVIPIGGMHIEQNVKPLPEDLQKLMDNARNGVIYFSMGSNLKGKDWPNEIKQDLLKLFAGLKQTVLWKFEEELPNKPDNVYIQKWMPQSSVLAHPNCIIFITHGGLLSTTEAVHFGKPIIGIPVYFDQFNNVDRAVRRGFATKVHFGYDLAEELDTAIKDMLSNPTYREKAKELSFIYHHRPIPPGDELVHWVEHVVKTRGALHLRSPALMLPWYQKMYLDLVAVIIVLCLLIIIPFSYFCIRKPVESPNKKKL